jgi:hypothetical protein
MVARLAPNSWATTKCHLLRTGNVSIPQSQKTVTAFEDINTTLPVGAYDGFSDHVERLHSP